MSKLIDLVGQTFDRLTVIKRAKRNKYIKQASAHWWCQCSCGKIVIIDGHCLRRGDTRSCGCIKREQNREQVKTFISIRTTHGMKGTPEYAAWLDMRNRCYRTKTTGFKYYGGRGITVCDEWKHDFMAFYRHVGKRPSTEHSIDRINNNGDYKPGNVRWATKKEQQNNKSNNRKMTIQGWTMNITQWAYFVGISKNALFYRIQSGWPLAKAVFKPVKQRACIKI